MLRMNNGADSLEKSRRLTPASIQVAGAANPVLSLGDPGILKARKLAFFCSVKCPGEPIVQAYDFSRALRDAGVTVIGGFQSPIERDCFDILLHGTQPVIVCPARSLQNMRLPAGWKTSIEQGRLLLLSPFAEHFRRPTVELSKQRNEFIATLADQVLFIYANPGGKTEALAKSVISSGKPVFTLDSKENLNLLALGAKALKSDDVVGQLGKTI